MSETWPIELEADTAGFEQSLKHLESVAEGFGTTLTGALKSAALSGKSLEDVLLGLGRSMAGRALDSALKPLGTLMDQAFSGFLGGIMPFAKGGVTGGGIVSAPTLFSLGNRLGMMGEAGAEAIMPLARGADGRLGVRGAGGAAPITINMTVHASDAASFKRSEGQISALLARSVSRGARNL